MKILISLFSLLLISQHLFAQILNPKEVLKQKSTDRANNRIDQSIDKGLDKVENLFKKKEKKPKKDKKNDESTNENTNNSGNSSNNNNSAGNNSNNNSSGNTSKPNFKTYTKFDFVSGEKVLAFDDFSTTNQGDFPLGWNTNSSAEIVTVAGNLNKWLFM